MRDDSGQSSRAKVSLCETAFKRHHIMTDEPDNLTPQSVRTPEALDRLASSDQALIRVLEDLIETLVSRNLIHFTDLPEAAQTKLLERRSLRRSLNSLQLLQDDDQDLI